MKHTSKGATLLKQVLATKRKPVDWDMIAPPIKPTQILEIRYSPETLDCYTFIMRPENLDRPFYYDMLCTCTSGRNYSQWGELPAANISACGERVQWQALPEQLQRHVEGRLK